MMADTAAKDPIYAAYLNQVNAAVVIRNRIMDEGKMATKTLVEYELMPLCGLDHQAAHGVLNYIEYHNILRPIEYEGMPS